MATAVVLAPSSRISNTGCGDSPLEGLSPFEVRSQCRQPPDAIVKWLLVQGS